jgi:hypothetical protein
MRAAIHGVAGSAGLMINTLRPLGNVTRSPTITAGGSFSDIEGTGSLEPGGT